MAARNGDADALRSLLDEGRVDVNGTDAVGCVQRYLSSSMYGSPASMSNVSNDTVSGDGMLAVPVVMSVRHVAG